MGVFLSNLVKIDLDFYLGYVLLKKKAKYAPALMFTEGMGIEIVGSAPLAVFKVTDTHLVDFSGVNPSEQIFVEVNEYHRIQRELSEYLGIEIKDIIEDAENNKEESSVINDTVAEN